MRVNTREMYIPRLAPIPVTVEGKSSRCNTQEIEQDPIA